MQGHAASEDALTTVPSSPTRRLCSGQDDVDCDDDDGDDTGGIHFFFSAPASPVHYILRSPPASSSSAASVQYAEGDGCPAAAGDFEFAARHRVAGTGMSSAEDLFLSGRIRVGGLSPIRQETDHGEEEDGDDGGGHSPRPRRARSGSPPQTPRFAENGAAETPSDSVASSSSSSSSSASSYSSASSSAKTIRRRISLRDLLGRSGSDSSAGPAAAAAISSGAEAERSSFWLPSIWPSRTKKAPLLPCPCPAPPHPGRRSTSSVRAAPGGGGHGHQREGAPPRRTTSLPYRQGLVLGCLGLGARSYGLAKSMHPLSTR